MEAQDDTLRDADARFHQMPMPLRLRDWVAIVRRRKWLMLGLFIALVLGFVWYMAMAH